MESILSRRLVASTVKMKVEASGTILLKRSVDMICQSVDGRELGFICFLRIKGNEYQVFFALMLTS
jgi:hypothetical protein